MVRHIENEEQYQKSLKWLVEKAELLEDPLLDEVTKDKLMSQYDFVSDEVRRYRLGEMMEAKADFRTDEKKSSLTDWLDDD